MVMVTAQLQSYRPHVWYLWGHLLTYFWYYSTVLPTHWVTHLYKYDGQHPGTNVVHHAHVVGNQSLPTATAVEIELFWLVLVVIVGVVIQQVVLQAGARGGGVTAAEGDAVHQVAAVHVASYAAGDGVKCQRLRVRAGSSRNMQKQCRGTGYRRTK